MNNTLGTFIQIAIDYGYKDYLKPKVDDFKIGGVYLTNNIYGLFISGDFIDSITKAVYKNLIKTSGRDDKSINQENFQKDNDFIYLQNKEMWNIFNGIYEKGDYENNLFKVKQILTRELAYAIRDTKVNNNKIGDFIENIYFLIK